MRRWLLLALLTAAATYLLELFDVDAAALFAGLVIAGVLAIAGLAPRPRATSPETPDDPDAPVIPRRYVLAAQGVLGVYIGTIADTDTLSGLGSAWFPVLIIGVGTLALSVAGGALLGLHKQVDPLTGSLALVAGGASGLVVVTRELGGDERMVAVIQYLRVALVTVSIPLVASLVFGQSSSAVTTETPSWTDQAWGLLLLAVCMGVGIPLGRLLHVPAGALLTPMALATIAELTGIAGDAAVSPMLLTIAYAVIGWQAGLGFTLPRLRAIGRVLPFALVLILAIGVGCALLGVLLSWWTGESMYDCYLATTPGGIYAVLAAATAAGGNVAFVVAAQILRVLLMLFVAPFAARAAARYLRRGQE
ncbi:MULTISPECIES: AbrB family transcriptional regulator [unclassified Gordonia (in: high G+C Gram-positive bacteria)]|uniref:AbrB family transcriptional regulator n=1 Tax=unclassified Gordonia (in: high G+C Gram-positive bacteria) TaxID=2657482 RepID=UPI001F0EF4B9|nr:AbrB family transcriptional regulator [Gordonia sp. ABSL49_1]MCH5644175.1 AbrB family transcriptional regulator [Gordonia sp. ABSL49_1]